MALCTHRGGGGGGAGDAGDVVFVYLSPHQLISEEGGCDGGPNETGGLLTDGDADPPTTFC